MSRQPEKPTDAQVIEELANIYNQRYGSDSLLEMIGFPRGRIPPFGEPFDFWRMVAERLQSGILPGGSGLRPLIGAAADMFPGNEVFRNWLRSDGPRVSRFAEDIAKIDRASPVEPIKVLFLAANPLNTKRILWDKEARMINEISQDSESLTRPIEVKLYPGVQPDDLKRVIRRENPAIVHFSGHGEAEKGLLLDDGRGKKRPVSFEALGMLFHQLLRDNIRIRCVVLNGCCTALGSELIGKSVEVVIGTTSAIADDAATAFSRGFYRTQAEGRAIGYAIEDGKYEMLLEQDSAPRGSIDGEHDRLFDPKLIVVVTKEGLNLEEFFL
jgi:hypothetical protein